MNNLWLIGIAVSILSLGLRWYFKRRHALEIDSCDGTEVYRGSAEQADERMHTLIDAGIVAWCEAIEGGHRAIYVDNDQLEEIPHLLHTPADS